LVRFDFEGVFYSLLEQVGQMPLPPYITERLFNPESYQTVYSTHPGSAAAPTAGLHFTKELLENIRQKGVNIGKVTLHVGLGTFRPVKVEHIEEHHMHSEFYSIPAETADLVNKTKERGGRVICVGTTSCRTVESAAAASPDGRIHPHSGDTDIFITPGFHTCPAPPSWPWWRPLPDWTPCWQPISTPCPRDIASTPMGTRC